MGRSDLADRILALENSGAQLKKKKRQKRGGIMGYNSRMSEPLFLWQFLF